MYEISAWEYELLLEAAAALQSTPDLSVCLRHATAPLRKLTGADHIALGVSRCGSPFDYEWHSTTLQRFFEGYGEIAKRDFLMAALIAAPDLVLRDDEIITRKQYERRVLNQHARAAGARFEHAIGVSFSRHENASAIFTAFRERRAPFGEREAGLIQYLLAHLRNAVRASREYARMQREIWLEPIAQQAGVAAVWVDAEIREIARTAYATKTLETYFLPHERLNGTLPEVLREYIKACLTDQTGRAPAPWTRQGLLGSLRTEVVAVQEGRLWALVFATRGIDPALSAKLSPRLRTIASDLLGGMTNEEIARRDGRALATIKQQSSELYRRLGVDGRKGLMRLAGGFGHLNKAASQTAQDSRLRAATP